MSRSQITNAFYRSMQACQRALGRDGPLVGAVGYGALGLAGYYGPVSEADSMRAISHALGCGANLIDTADSYAAGQNERIVGQAVRRQPGSFVSSKFGIVYDASHMGTLVRTGWGIALQINGRPSYVDWALHRTLERLARDVIDLWYLHYPDPCVPIEDTVGAMGAAVTAGKVRFLGLSNVSAEQVRRAHATHPIAAVQFEYSLWRREAEQDLLPALRELGIALVAWSPLGAGFLAGLVEPLTADDFRHHNPRFASHNLGANRERFAPLVTLAASLDMTPAQLALAWLLHQGNEIIPIPGSRRTIHISENVAAREIALTPEILARLDEIAPPGAAIGGTLI
jgi:aryl-alcohol dehydrogenase-like predicted oxidoreductase